MTGHSGFVGRSVRRYLAREEGAGNEDNAGVGWELVCLPDNFDIRDPSLAALLAALRPDAVIHLAALSSVAESFRDPERYFDVNFQGTYNLLRGLRGAGFAGRLVFVGTGDCYGAVPDDALPVREDRPLRPRNPYAVSKTAAEALCYQWSQTENLDVVLVRPFNHVGPGQDVRFAVAGFARQVAAITLKREPPLIVVGNLDVSRDYSDVRDVVRGYFALLASGRRGEVYNVGSGREARLRDVLAMLVRLGGVSAEIRVDPARLRAGEQMRMLADVTKIQRETGWAARIGLETTLRDTLDEWKKRLSDE